MDYDMTKPCAKCPFRRGTVMKLQEGRILEIEALFGPSNGGQGGEFPCHETVDYDGEEDGCRDKSREKHCAGALIYAEKHEAPTQMMRITERFGKYDRTQLADPELVWEDVDEWLEEGACE